MSLAGDPGQKEQVIMPSIPQSLLWISLVVLWLFVLVPMLISKRDAVRRTSDVALATRVLNGGAGSRLLKRSGPAAGHRSDPHWKPEEDPAEDELAEPEQDQHDEDEHTDDLEATRPVAMNVAVAEEVPAEPDYLDVDVIEDSAALPAGVSAEVAEPSDGEADEETDAVAHSDAVADEDDRYEYVEDSSGLEPEGEAEEPEEADPRQYVPRGSSRR